MNAHNHPRLRLISGLLLLAVFITFQPLRTGFTGSGNKSPVQRAFVEPVERPLKAEFMEALVDDGGLAASGYDIDGLLRWFAGELIPFDRFATYTKAAVQLLRWPDPRSSRMGELAASQLVLVLGTDSHAEWLAVRVVL